MSAFRLRPEVVDRALLADDHARLAADDSGDERGATGARRHDVRADMAERRQAAAGRECGEPSETAPRDVFEEHALDGLLRAEGENLLERRVDGNHGPDHPTG